MFLRKTALIENLSQTLNILHYHHHFEAKTYAPEFKLHIFICGFLQLGT